MNSIRHRVSRLILTLLAAVTISGLPTSNSIAAESTGNLAFPDKIMIRLSSYSVNQASTDITVLSSSGVGTILSFDQDLGGEDSVTIPRLDGYYRFNKRHRIDFAYFRIDRDGLKTINAAVTIGDEDFLVNETIISEIKYSLNKLGYAYSFYHSPSVELSLMAGLNITEYDFNFSRDDGTNASTNGVSAPLPMFGFRMGYAIDSNWSVNYISESFFIEIDDTFKGTFLNYELNIEYKFDDKIALGAGLVRSSIDLEVDDSDWSGSIVDSYRGALLYAAYYF
jgi:hypothetical protein